jgi:hypothetical protein
MARISSLARGATMTPPITVPLLRRAMSLTNPSRKPCILALALVASGSLTRTASGISPEATAFSGTPTVAISGSVKIVAATFLSRSGLTASPSACHIAIRPCMAATEASISTPVQSPAAYTPGAEVRETLSTCTNPWSSTSTPASARPRPPVFGTMPTVSRQWVPRTVRPSLRVTATPSPVRVTRSALDLPSTVMPRRRNTSSTTTAASTSSCGSTRSREDTSVTWEPSAW